MATLERCPLVTDYDDSIGGEGEIVCGAVGGYGADDGTWRCNRGHAFQPCACGKPNCTGWRPARNGGLV